jgi:hypothetical protein
MAADASRSQSRDVDGLRRVARRLLDEAAAVDEDEDAAYGAARGDELPEELRDPTRRRQVIDELIRQAAQDKDRARGRARAGKAGKAERALALADQLTADAQAVAQAGLERPQARLARSQATLAKIRAGVQAGNEQRAAREAAAAAAGRTLPGARPVPVDEHSHVRRAGEVYRDEQALARRREQVVEVTGKRNLTDPDSRFMPVQGGGFVLGYNAQLAVSADYLILAVNVVQDTYDTDQMTPMFEQVNQAVGALREATGNPDLAVGQALMDAGYASADNFLAPSRLIALGKRDKITGDEPPTSPPGEDATPRQKMAWRLSTPEGRNLYKKRGATVEPVNSHLKDQRGLRRASRRGITAVLAELTLAALTTNLLRLHTTRPNALAATQ